MNSLIRVFMFVVVACGILGGCASMQPLSSYARSGDTVMIALGGTESNALVPVLRKENLSVSITDSLGNTYPVKVRYLYKVYSDQASAYSYRASQADNSGNWEGFVDPYQGQWLAILDLVDPVSGAPLILAEGSATLSVSSPEIDNAYYYTAFGSQFPWSNGDLSSIPIEILPGAGQSNPLNYQTPITYDPMKILEPIPEVRVSLQGTPPSALGGGEFVFTYADGDFTRAPRVIPSTPDPHVQIAFSRNDLGNGTVVLRVLVMNPNGFQTGNQRTNGLMNGKSQLRSLDFGIVWDPENTGITDANWQNSLQLQSAKYIDLAGDEVIGLTAGLEKVR